MEIDNEYLDCINKDKTWQKQMMDIHEKSIKDKQKIMEQVIKKELGINIKFDSSSA